MRTSGALPRDVLAMFHLLAQWGQSQGISDLRIEPGERGSTEAKITRYVRLPPPPAPQPRASSVKRPRRLVLGSPKPLTSLSAVVEVLPLTHDGGTGGLRQIRLIKRCLHCKKDKFIGEFPRQRGQADGHQVFCGPCKVAVAQRDRARRRHLEDPTIDNRLWSQVDKKAAGGCWLWQGGQQNQNYGYGYIQYRGSQRATHLVAWELLRGPRPKGRVAHHKCGDRRCVNPDHLIFVTRKELSLTWSKDNPFKTNARKTECHRGHAFTPSNTHHFMVGTMVTRVCLTCLRARNLRTTKKPNRPSDAVTPRAGKLLRKGELGIARMPAMIRDAARSCLALEILAGNVSKDSLPDALRKAKRAAWKDLPDKWKTVSLNETVGEDGGETFLDHLPDPSEVNDPLAALELAEGDEA